MPLSTNLAEDLDDIIPQMQEELEHSVSEEPTFLEQLEKFHCPVCRSCKSYVRGKKFNSIASQDAELVKVVCTTCGYILTFSKPILLKEIQC